jgi:hypothetical protein
MSWTGGHPALRSELTESVMPEALMRRHQPVEMIDRHQMLGRQDEFAPALGELTHASGWEPTFVFRLGYAEREARSAARTPATPRRRHDWITTDDPLTIDVLQTTRYQRISTPVGDRHAVRRPGSGPQARRANRLPAAVAATRTRVRLPRRGEIGAAPSSRPTTSYRNVLNAARSSDTKTAGCSHAAKCPPRSTSLKYARPG